MDEINTIASYPSSTYAYNVELYDDLVNALLQRLPLQLCKVSAVVLVSPYSLLVRSQEFYFSLFKKLAIFYLPNFRQIHV